MDVQSKMPVPPSCLLRPNHLSRLAISCFRLIFVLVDLFCGSCGGLNIEIILVQNRSREDGGLDLPDVECIFERQFCQELNLLDQELLKSACLFLAVAARFARAALVGQGPRGQGRHPGAVKEFAA